jgi:hypothetical protein
MGGDMPVSERVFEWQVSGDIAIAIQYRWPSECTLSIALSCVTDSSLGEGNIDLIERVRGLR